MMLVRHGAGPLVLAHRGGDLGHGENTLEAFAAARALGVRHIETDVHLSADGRVVVSHDPDLARCFGIDMRIGQLTWRELAELRTPTGERMPLLSEALVAFPDMYFNVDAKAFGVERPLLEVVERHGAADRVLIASFSESRLRRVRAMSEGGVATSLGVAAVARLVAAAQTATSPTRWRLPGPRQGAVAVQVPIRQGALRVVDARFVAAAHAAGLAVHVWTVDEEAEVVELIGLGVDGIVTNRPGVVRDLLDARGLWAEPEPPSSRRSRQGARD
ncbi:glycerophosphodiester phosphodiesterase [Actinomyces sp. B33]|uniref:glycerophosphodiester phosphodiesterase family protein n=1 Tax=Actinomyces sp. B33 TaxID=2942131 RepID=UPI0023405F71|nr:glycerophosphodiester phosphodiesterase family protein [Actinomyces sp. B33]MDC4232708.1 glycerophosphodiester phosphodiesterase [Actinomyces sp. B33]